MCVKFFSLSLKSARVADTLSLSAIDRACHCRDRDSPLRNSTKTESYSEYFFYDVTKHAAFKEYTIDS